MAWVLGRLSFEEHAKPGGLFEAVEKENGLKIICIVMSKQWKEIPQLYRKRKNIYLCADFDEVSFNIYFSDVPNKSIIHLLSNSSFFILS